MKRDLHSSTVAINGENINHLRSGVLRHEIEMNHNMKNAIIFKGFVLLTFTHSALCFWVLRGEKCLPVVLVLSSQSSHGWAAFPCGPHTRQHRKHRSSDTTTAIIFQPLPAVWHFNITRKPESPLAWRNDHLPLYGLSVWKSSSGRPQKVDKFNPVISSEFIC